MQDIAVLALLPWLTIDDAAQLIADSGSSLSQQEMVVAKLRKAVEAGDLRAELPIVRWESGSINQMVTTVQRADLDDWCQKRDIALPGRTTGQAGGEATAALSNATTPADTPVKLNPGPNPKAVLDSYIARRAAEIYEKGNTNTMLGIAKIIHDELKAQEAEGERGGYLSVETIRKQMPTGLTGGRGKNRKK